LKSFGWEEPVDLGTVEAARGTEAMLLRWMAAVGRAGNGEFQLSRRSRQARCRAAIAPRSRCFGDERCGGGLLRRLARKDLPRYLRNSWCRHSRYGQPPNRCPALSGPDGHIACNLRRSRIRPRPVRRLTCGGDRPDGGSRGSRNRFL
jgi:hypothetical protein